MKRGSSGLSLVVGIDKPEGMTSHDVVNRVRRVFGEKRVGHTGTLDPAASGAMAVCVGPATKLSQYLTAHRKAYCARIVFGVATDTDDAEGTVIEELPTPERLLDVAVAEEALAQMQGAQEQMPPAYSAIKVGGVKSYEAARKGHSVDLQARPIEVYAAELLGAFPDEVGRPCWDVLFDVSAGTYIRSLARDLGRALGTCAHLGSLRRVRSGALSVANCVSLEALEADPNAGRLDPLGLLELRFFTPADDRQCAAVRNGGKIGLAGLELFELSGRSGQIELSGSDALASGGAAAFQRSTAPLKHDELVAVLVDNELAALYAYDEQLRCLKANCGFSQGVSRGTV